MSKINILGFEIANLIAAGEVVERPASVVKELVENAIDSGALGITVEIKNGGVSLIRVTDNGCGMSAEDLPISIRRHATSKISRADDLASVMTLGFRGEALAAISSVCDLTIITKTEQSEMGSMLTASGGQLTDLSEVGCAAGTTVICERLFGNVPARRKFLKKDRTEAMTVAALMEKIALSRPDISMRYICDGETRFTTVGDGRADHALYALYGREFASSLLKVEGERGGVSVSGYIGNSENTKNNRNYQNVFINGRYVRSRTVCAAVEQAFTSYIAPERFPVCDIYLQIDASLVDVNVHPSKMEVRFSDERPVFEAVYWGVRTTLEKNTLRPEMKLSARENTAKVMGAFVPLGGLPATEQLKIEGIGKAQVHTGASAAPSAATIGRAETQRGHENIYTPAAMPYTAFGSSHLESSPVLKYDSVPEQISEKPREHCAERSSEPCAAQHMPYAAGESGDTGGGEEMPCAGDTACVQESADTSRPQWRYIGEIFDCYVIIEYENSLMLIDKHAAHERILFEQFRRTLGSGERLSAQRLLIPLSPDLPPTLYAAACDGKGSLEAIGYGFVLCEGTVSVTEIPASLSRSDAESFFVQLCSDMAQGEGQAELVDAARRERMLYQMACKAAIKGGRAYDRAHIDWLCDRLLSLPDITVCPHGRPVAYKMTHTQLDRQFGRV